MEKNASKLIPPRGVKARRICKKSGAFVAAICLAFQSGAFAASLSIPEGIAAIEEGAFQGNAAITSVVVPETVTLIEKNAFADCDNLESIRIYSKDAVLKAGSLGDSDNKPVIYGYDSSTAKTYAANNGHTFKLFSEEQINALTKYAKTLIGTSYSKMDCVGFVYNCYRKALGITIQNTCDRIYLKSSGTKITSIKKLKPGDIICWQDDNSGKIDDCEHVGMYLGAGEVNGKHYNSGVFIESSRGYGGVRYNYIASSGSGYYTRNFLCAWRIIDSDF